MRTNIVLQDELVRRALRYSKAKTKRGLVEESLREFVRLREDEERRATHEQRYQDLVLKLAERRLSRSSRDLLREDRERP
jgi:Arc/MetJ family transcription regulator